jgi:hypothetical protein
VVQRSPRLEPGADQRDAELEPAAELASTESTRAPVPELATRPESESVSPASGEKRARPPYLRLVR